MGASSIDLLICRMTLLWHSAHCHASVHLINNSLATFKFG